MKVNALVDTGAYMSCTSESTQEQLPIVENVKHKWLMVQSKNLM